MSAQPPGPEAHPEQAARAQEGYRVFTQMAVARGHYLYLDSGGNIVRTDIATGLSKSVAPRPSATSRQNPQASVPPQASDASPLDAGPGASNSDSSDTNSSCSLPGPPHLLSLLPEPRNRDWGVPALEWGSTFVPPERDEQMRIAGLVQRFVAYLQAVVGGGTIIIEKILDKSTEVCSPYELCIASQTAIGEMFQTDEAIENLFNSILSDDMQGKAIVWWSYVPFIVQKLGLQSGDFYPMIQFLDNHMDIATNPDNPILHRGHPLAVQLAIRGFIVALAANASFKTEPPKRDSPVGASGQK